MMTPCRPPMLKIMTLIDTKPVHEASLTWDTNGLHISTLGECRTVSVGEAARLSIPPNPLSYTICVTGGGNTFTLKCPTSDGSAFLDVVVKDLHDLIVREIMRLPGVKSEDMWRLSLASRFTATHMNDREHLLTKCACVASFCPTLLTYLSFFRANLHFANRGLVDEIVRYGRAIYTLQRRVRTNRCKGAPCPAQPRS